MRCSRADDYSENGNKGATLKVMLACNVVLGRGFMVYRTNQSLKEPPAGYDSVRHSSCLLHFTSEVYGVSVPRLLERSARI